VLEAGSLIHNPKPMGQRVAYGQASGFQIWSRANYSPLHRWIKYFDRPWRRWARKKPV